MTGLTPVQAKTLAFIRAFIAEKSWSPSFDEICAGLGKKSRGDVQRIIRALAARGALTYTPRLRRSIVLLEQPGTGDELEFLDDHLAVWVRVMAAKIGVKPLEFVNEAVRDAYNTRRKPEQNVARATSAVAA